MMKKILKALGLILAMLGIYYVAQAIVATVFALVYAIKEGVVAGMTGQMPDVNTLTNELMSFISAQTPWVIIIAAAISLPFFYLFYRRRRGELHAFISVRSLTPLSIPVLVVFALCVNVLIELLLSLISQLHIFSNFFDRYNNLAGLFTSGSFIMSLIAIGIVGPLFEEILFRGLVFGELRKISKVQGAIFLQALLFGIYHMDVIQGTYAFLIGILLGFVYYRSNSIIAPMIIHICINSSSILMSYLLSQSQYEKWGGIIAIAGVALFFLTGAFLLLGKSFRRSMDNSLYEQNHLPRLPGADDGTSGYQGPAL